MTFPINAGKPFTASDDATIREMHAKGACVPSIAGVLERTEAGIEARLEYLGLRQGRCLLREHQALGRRKRSAARS